MLEKPDTVNKLVQGLVSEAVGMQAKVVHKILWPSWLNLFTVSGFAYIFWMAMSHKTHLR